VRPPKRAVGPCHRPHAENDGKVTWSRMRPMGRNTLKGRWRKRRYDVELPDPNPYSCSAVCIVLTSLENPIFQLDERSARLVTMDVTGG